jgi:AraC-like DNA-binding protein
VGRRRYGQLGDASWLRRRYLDEGASMNVIAAEVGCGTATVRGALVAAGISRRPGGGRHQHPELTDRTWLRRRYVEELASPADIASKLGCSEHSVRRALRAADIRLQGISRSHRRYWQLADPSWLRQRHVEQAVTATGIAAELGCARSTVHQALKAAGIAPINHRRYPQLADPSWLRRRYLTDGASLGDIAAELGCDRTTVRDALTAAGIPLKGRIYQRRYPRLGDHDWLRQRYLDEGASLADLAAEIGCSITAVRQALAAARITPRPRGHWSKKP